MKRDLNLWRLLLIERRDGVTPSELANFDEPIKTYNAALLVNGGYVEGRAIEGGSGGYAAVIMTQLTNSGHDLLEELERKHQTPKANMATIKPGNQLSIFISHSKNDEAIAESLISLLRSALNIASEEIRCTSVNGFRLPIGADTESKLKTEVNSARVFIGLITPSSIASAYVMFELGARWGASLHLAPLLAAGAGVDLLKGPLSSLNALSCEEIGQVHQLIGDVADQLGIKKPNNPGVYQKAVDALIQASKKNRQNASQNITGANPERVDIRLTSLLVEELDVDTTSVLKLFSTDTPLPITKDSVVRWTKMNHLRVDQILENLVDFDLLSRGTSIGLGNSYRLTSAGRDYLLKNNLVT